MLGVILATVSACGGGDSGGGGSDVRTSAEAIEPEAQQRAESIVLKLSDFPTGWRGSAPEGSDDDDDGFRECVGTDYSALTRIADAESHDFSMGESAEVTSDVAIFKDEQQASDALAEFSKGMNGTAAEDCFQDRIEKAARDESTGSDEFNFGEVDIGQLNIKRPEKVEDTAAWQIVVPVEITSGVGEGFTPSFYIEYIALREGDAVAYVTTQDSFDPLDSGLRDKLVATTAGRMEESATSK